MRNKLALFAFALVLAACHMEGPLGPRIMSRLPGCGVERQAVKVLSDPAATAISSKPTPTTVATLNAVPRTKVGSDTSRIVGLETTLWDLTAIVCLIKDESDSDKHVVIGDSAWACEQKKGRPVRFVGPTMIAESPAATCIAGSHFEAQLIEARKAVERWRPGNVVHIQGVGFVDFDHGQTGRARSSLEIHPILMVLP
jgi:hypothetical protein